MFSALISFLGGSAFRMIWGEVSSWYEKKQDHQQEIERMKIQAEADRLRHSQDMERIQLQSNLGIREIEVKGDMAIQQTEAMAFLEAMKAANQPTGIKFVDAWNGSVRPAYATVALGLWIAKLASQGFAMQPFDVELMALIAGFFFADRSLRHRGK